MPQDEPIYLLSTSMEPIETHLLWTSAFSIRGLACGAMGHLVESPGNRGPRRHRLLLEIAHQRAIVSSKPIRAQELVLLSQEQY